MLRARHGLQNGERPALACPRGWCSIGGMKQPPANAVLKGLTLYDHHLDEARPFWVSGDRQPQPTPLDLHIHQGVEVGIGLSGCMEISFSEAVVSVGPGDVWLCAMWEPHGWRVTAPDTLTVKVIFLPSFLGDEMLGDRPWLSLFATPPSQRPRVESREMREEALRIGHDFHREIVARRAGWESMVRIEVLRALIQLSREWTPPPSAGQSSGQSASAVARIMPALQRVHSDPRRRITLAEAAAACALSRSSFGALFKHAMGLSFGRFCLRARLTIVAHHLLTTDMTVETIAEEAGFGDGSHLHHAFLKEYGCTPRRYRDDGQRRRDAPKSVR